MLIVRSFKKNQLFFSLLLELICIFKMAESSSCMPVFMLFAVCDHYQCFSAVSVTTKIVNVFYSC